VKILQQLLFIQDEETVFALLELIACVRGKRGLIIKIHNKNVTGSGGVLKLAPLSLREWRCVCIFASLRPIFGQIGASGAQSEQEKADFQSAAGLLGGIVAFRRDYV